ncbi:MAG: hypothetical protein J6T32_04520 [Paludibacteraceae bacterium]|nr:hypothetical protein [Paludibacteraceae bacterium]
MIRAKQYIGVLLLFVASPLLAGTSVFSIGVRGGGQMWLPQLAPEANGSVRGDVGMNGMLDLRYAWYGDLSSPVSAGFMLGAGVGYGAMAIKGSTSDVFRNIDYLGNPMDYRTTAHFKQSEQFAKAEFLILFALRAGGFAVQLGPRIMLPFAATRRFEISNVDIDAYYEQYNVHVHNRVITGAVEQPYTRLNSEKMPKWNILVGIEAGWEWPLGRNANTIGLQAYADIGLWNAYKAAPYTRLLDVAPITDAANPSAKVTVGSGESVVGFYNYLDFGLRLYYAFSVSSSKRHRHVRTGYRR